MSNKEKRTILIKEKASQLGFGNCGISRATFLEEEAIPLEKWLKKDYHGTMHYMNRNFDKRLDPRLLVEDAKSVVSLSYNYYPKKYLKLGSYKISKYAFGQDYHKVVKDKVFELLTYIRKHIGDVNGRVFVDSAPILERAWAKKSGMGWVGKNSNLITKKTGSFFFLAELIIDLDLNYDTPTTDHCGSCTKCIDACPTNAIPAPFEIDSNHCISYLTIEYREALPKQISQKMDDWIFGCDICQDVCPWNRFSKPHQEPLFEPHTKLTKLSKEDWETLEQSTFNEIFRSSAVKRTKFSGLKRNIDFQKNKATFESKLAATMNLSQEEWSKQLSDDSNAVILDVRTEAEVENGFIPKAKNIDFNGGADFIRGLETLDKAQNYYVYCRSGNRSSQACEVMKQLGFENLYNLEGGFDAWEGEVEEMY